MPRNTYACCFCFAFDDIKNLQAIEIRSPDPEHIGSQLCTAHTECMHTNLHGAMVADDSRDRVACCFCNADDAFENMLQFVLLNYSKNELTDERRFLTHESCLRDRMDQRVGLFVEVKAPSWDESYGDL